MSTGTLNGVGKYVANITSGTLSESSKGNPQVVVQLEVTGFIDPAAGLVSVGAPFERRMYLSMSGNALDYTEKKLKALQFNGDFGAMEFGVTQDVQVLCSHEPNDAGELKERWELAKWGDAPEVKSAGSAVIQKMNALWKARQQQGGKPANGSAPSKPAVRTQAPSRTPPAKPTTPLLPGATRDEAWAALCDTHQNKPDDWLSEQWQKMVGDAEIKFSKGEADFSPADWASVKLSAELPF
jgi:hypothetical protein